MKIELKLIITSRHTLERREINLSGFIVADKFDEKELSQILFDIERVLNESELRNGLRVHSSVTE